MAIERYEHVIHIVSEVTGKLNDDYSPMSVIASLLPTGTVSGAPKLEQFNVFMKRNHINAVFIVEV